MFRHILIPTDGSRFAARGIRAGVRLARALGARVSGVYVMQPLPSGRYGESAVAYAGISAQGWRKRFEKAARTALAGVASEARAAKVPCTTAIVRHARPWNGILAAARARRCDAIAMASHGRGALGGLILGSETQRVLAHSRIPVLVIRQRTARRYPRRGSPRAARTRAARGAG